MKTKPVCFLFRFAAGPRIGFGHLMRCCALARALNVRPLVSIRGGAGARRTARALGCHLAGRRALSQVDLLVVDDPSPRSAHDWLVRAKRAGTSAATIHDLGIGSRAADLIIDGSVTARPRRGRAITLRGPRFTVLDLRVASARAERRRRRTSDRGRVLIALGGGSYIFSVVQPLVDDIARRCPGATITVAAGFCRQTRTALGAARWIDRPDGLVRDLAKSDVAVVGGGVTLYEACAIGVPTVAIAVVPAQRAAVAAFARRGAVIDAGALAEQGMVVSKAGAAVARLLRDASARRRSSSAGRRLIDGRGAIRIAARFRALAATAASRRSGRA
jgi:spore coat polysaccharide biosynthesis predicted glycosyltransferase SpsG